MWRPTRGKGDAKPKALGRREFAIEPKFEGYLIDGEQRLTSLEAAYGLYSGEDKRGAELRCYLDLAAVEKEEGRDTRLFVSYAGNKLIARRVENGDDNLISVSELFDGQNHELRKRTEENLRLLGWDARRVDTALMRLDWAFKMLDQQVPCTTISDWTTERPSKYLAGLTKAAAR